jgi:NAD(P)-dependent dehydrogenase (short-subunit alcohol dehydrogenase family)
MSSVSLDFSGRNALIIGATEGIGRATALAFAAAGANVFAAGLGAERGQTLVTEIRGGGCVDA